MYSKEKGAVTQRKPVNHQHYQMGVEQVANTVTKLGAYCDEGYVVKPIENTVAQPHNPGSKKKSGY